MRINLRKTFTRNFQEDSNNETFEMDSFSPESEEFLKEVTGFSEYPEKIKKY